ncbi:hypothetical protein SS50377_27105 [Spironucleus salmonicida]|uniref:Uncharacterized protein n=1 Tax=Spironucleus salmonicida TaxID=348837 RepID=V6LSL2_9EUKA|nr:hypothetical protein SS50377_27100 [Spironucleus salmonicida]KAH0570814.1 hypothetical protein SS50377_27105 [Spironucleus salmonicida]|eukprot:EST43769.1 Hypothetical protein SS50377_16509 [Spironucleus salmonicida]
MSLKTIDFDDMNISYYHSSPQGSAEKLLFIPDLLIPASVYVAFLEKLGMEYICPILAPDQLQQASTVIQGLLKALGMDNGVFVLGSHLTGASIDLLPFRRNIARMVLFDPLVENFIPYKLEHSTGTCCSAESLDMDIFRAQLFRRNFEAVKDLGTSDLELRVRVEAFCDAAPTPYNARELIQFAQDELVSIRVIRCTEQRNMTYTTKSGVSDQTIDGPCFMFDDEKAQRAFILPLVTNSVSCTRDVELSD